MVKVIAHRGASARAPENTLEAFRLARDLGADWVELDARRTADGAVVVHHDARLPDGRAIVELTRADLPASVCSLADALDACAGMGVNIEIKNLVSDPDFEPGELVADAVVAEVAGRAAQSEVLVSSFSRAAIDRVHRLDPAIPTAYLFFAAPDDPVALADEIRRAGHAALHPWDHLADVALVRAAHDAGLEVNVWTVDDPERMGALVDLRVDGICTNVPDVARAVLTAR